jgi:uncharacterized protein (DUF1800 family)
MSKKSLLAAAFVASLAAAPTFSLKKLSGEKKIVHALRRLTFGPRPGDVERVRSMGLNKWIDQQLHPERIAENPALEPKLAKLASLRMSSSDIVQLYPAAAQIRAMAEGRQAFPTDPEQRKILERLAERFKRRLQPNQQPGQPPQGEPPWVELTRLLTPDQQRTLRMGTTEEKLRLIGSLPDEKREDVLEILPPGARRDILERGPTELRRKVLHSSTPQQVVFHDLVEGKLLRAVSSNRQLEEVLVDFWYNHFNVYFDKGADRYMVTAYERDAIRPHVLGKFKDLLRATAEHPAMLFYLDNWQSVDPQAFQRMGRGRAIPKKAQNRGLNENYARELLELHTLGVDGGYTQKDVMEVARCFTGWTIRVPGRGGDYEFNPQMHDPGEKTVLGVTIPAGGGVEDGLKVLDIVVAHPSTARFISRRLAERFVADNPPASLVHKMAQTFASTEGDIRAVLKTMFESREFWSEGAYRAKLKTPLDMVASAVRALDADVDFTAALAVKIGELGQPLYRKQEPTGYSNANEEWLNSTALLARMNFAQALAANNLPGVRVDVNRVVKGKQPEPAALARALLLTDVSEQTRTVIAKGSEPAQVAGLILGSPDFQRR